MTPDLAVEFRCLLCPAVDLSPCRRLSLLSLEHTVFASTVVLCFLTFPAVDCRASIIVRIPIRPSKGREAVVNCFLGPGTLMHYLNEPPALALRVVPHYPHCVGEGGSGRLLACLKSHSCKWHRCSSTLGWLFWGVFVFWFSRFDLFF